MNLQEHLQQALVTLVKDRGYTHAEVAEKTAIHKSNVTRYLNGSLTLTAERAERMLLALGGQVALPKILVKKAGLLVIDIQDIDKYLGYQTWHYFDPNAEVTALDVLQIQSMPADTRINLVAAHGALPEEVLTQVAFFALKFTPMPDGRQVKALYSDPRMDQALTAMMAAESFEEAEYARILANTLVLDARDGAEGQPVYSYRHQYHSLAIALSNACGNALHRELATACAYAVAAAVDVPWHIRTPFGYEEPFGTSQAWQAIIDNFIKILRENSQD